MSSDKSIFKSCDMFLMEDDIISQLLSNSVGNVSAYRQLCVRWEYSAIQYALYVKHHNSLTLYKPQLELEWYLDQA